MLELLFFIIISVAASQMWSHSTIFSWIRRKIVKIPLVRDALLCAVCSSFWIGLLISFFINPLIAYGVLSHAACGLVNYLICGILFKNNILTED